jgi:AcrR family transcriptional regulator
MENPFDIVIRERPGSDSVRRPSVVRRAEIVDAALYLFANKGYHGTSVKEIAGALGIRAPSLYNHVTSKQEILEEVMFKTMQTLLDDFDEAVARSESVVERIWFATETHVRYHARYPRESHVGNREIATLEEPSQSRIRALRRTYAHNWQTLIESGVTGGELSVANPRLASYAILEMGVGVSLWFRPDGELTEAEVAATYADMAVKLVSGTLPHGRPQVNASRRDV